MKRYLIQNDDSKIPNNFGLIVNFAKLSGYLKFNLVFDMNFDEDQNKLSTIN